MTDYNLNLLGIQSVAIIDDDLNCVFGITELQNAGIDSDVIDALKDKNSPSCSALIKNLERVGVPSSSFEDRLKAVSERSNIEYIPEFFVENIINEYDESKRPARDKLLLIKKSLTSLGVDEAMIHEFSSVSEFGDSEHHFDLIILDLFLVEGDSKISLGFLENRLLKKCNAQYILMSYDSKALESEFRRIHVQHKVSSSQLKVFKKPELNNDEWHVQWKVGIYQLAIERKLIKFQQSTQETWTSIINKATDDFIKRIWSLDSFGFNKLRLTAEADHMSLTEYMAEVMHKGLLAELQDINLPTCEMIRLSEELASIDDGHLLNPSNEIFDSYHVLKEVFSDFRSHRSNHLSQIDTAGLEYKDFICSLKFGSVLQCKKSGNLYLHLTQACDYIHIPHSDSKNHMLFLFPGKKSFLLEDPQDGQKKMTVSYIHTDSGIENITWNLRQLKTLSIKELYEDRESYKVVAQLRESMAQAVSHKFGSTVSRVGALRVPWFENVRAFHCRYEKKNNNFPVTVTGKETLDARSINNPKINQYAELFYFNFFKVKEGSEPIYKVTFKTDSIRDITRIIKVNPDDSLALSRSFEVRRNESVTVDDNIFMFHDTFKRLLVSCEKLEDFEIFNNKSIFLFVVNK